jgi:hypothetical protein
LYKKRIKELEAKRAYWSKRFKELEGKRWITNTKIYI